VIPQGYSLNSKAKQRGKKMSEKTAKAQRKEQPKILHEMRIRVVEVDKKNHQVHVENIPSELVAALDLLHQATKIVVGVYMEAAAKGDANKREPSRIIPATMVPRLH
jgi:hypothetical protein